MVTIRAVDFSNQEDCQTFTDLLDHYSRHPFGTGAPLPAAIQSVLAERFAAATMTFAFFAIVDDAVVGLAACQEGFSTFKAAPRINIHDIVVHQDYRGQGIGRALLAAVRDDAQARGACAVTLEVRVDNHNARRLYESFGFSGIQLPVSDDSTLFGTLHLHEKSDE